MSIHACASKTVKKGYFLTFFHGFIDKNVKKDYNGVV